MKKLIVLILICATGVIACSKKIIPESGSANSSKTENEKEERSSRKSDKTNTNTSSATTPSFNDMKGGKPGFFSAPDPTYLEMGKTVFLSNCGKCHALKNVHDYTADRWNNILKVMIPRAKLSNTEGDQVKAFILAKANK